LQTDDFSCYVIGTKLGLKVVKLFAGEVELCAHSPIDDRHVEGHRETVGVDGTGGEAFDDGAYKDGEEETDDWSDDLADVGAPVAGLQFGALIHQSF
jgi:hypothetical protein